MFPSSSPKTSECEKDVKALQFIEEMTKNCDSVQENVLSEILIQNARTEYLQQWSLDGATDRKSFKSKVPISTYEDIKPYIERIANGDHSPILSMHPISEFLSSSGTSGGESKLLPSIDADKDREQKLKSLLTPIMKQYVPDMDKGKNLYFFISRSESKTTGGLVVQPGVISYLKSKQFRTRPFDPYNVYTSPEETILCVDSYQSMYSQMLYGLIYRKEVIRCGATFAYGLVHAIKFLQLHWKQLTLDIESGNLNSDITDPAIRKGVSKMLKSSPEEARSIRDECCDGNWERIITRIWPNTKFLDAIVTGSMVQYIPILDYYSGNLPKTSTVYASSECFFGLNLTPLVEASDVCYTIMPFMGYFEFIPHNPENPLKISSDSPPPLVDLADVEMGKEYEIVVTTYSGLCRYRVGDILQVKGFHNSAPQFKFIRRKNILLSLEVDKTDEIELQAAVENASQLLKEFNTTVIEYTSYSDTSMIPGHYVIYWELLMKDGMKKPTKKVLDQCCLAMEESLNAVYRELRVGDKSIGPLEIRVVRAGTFEKVMDYAISRGASLSQYKVPRCVSSESIKKVLDSGVVSVHFSPSPPHWTAGVRF